MDNKYFVDFMTKAKVILQELKVSDEEKTLLSDLVEALLNQDPEMVESLIAPIEEGKKLEMIQAATEIIHEVRLDAEDEIAASGDLVQIDRLKEMIEKEDHNLALLIDTIFKNAQQVNPPAVKPTQPATPAQ